MIDVVLAKLDRLSGEAVKLALYLAVHAPTQASLEGPDFVVGIATAEFVFDAAKKVSIPPAVVRKALKELTNHEVIAKAGRSGYTWNDRSVSAPLRTFARSSEPGDLADRTRRDEESESPPWERSRDTEASSRSDEEQGREAALKGERSSTIGREQRSDRARANAELCSTPEVRAARSHREPRSFKASDSVCSSCGETDEARCECFEPFVSAHQFVIASVVAMYTDCYRAKLTVDGKAGSIVKRLLKSHSAIEIVRRARVMFYEQRKWPSPPYHFGSLSVHFDSFVEVKKTAGGMADRDKRKTGVSYYGKVSDDV